MVTAAVGKFSLARRREPRETVWPRTMSSTCGKPRMVYPTMKRLLFCAVNLENLFAGRTPQNLSLSQSAWLAGTACFRTVSRCHSESRKTPCRRVHRAASASTMSVGKPLPIKHLEQLECTGIGTALNRLGE